MVFNEAILYKDRASSSEAKKPVMIPLKNIPKYEVSESSGTEDQETKAPGKVQTTFLVELRRSSIPDYSAPQVQNSHTMRF